MKKFKGFSEKAKSKLSKVGCSIMAAAGTLSLATPTVHADIESDIKKACKTVGNLLLKVMVPVGAVAFIIAAILRAVSKNPRTAEEATEWMKRILISLALALLASSIFNWIGGGNFGSNTFNVT